MDLKAKKSELWHRGSIIKSILCIALMLIATGCPNITPPDDTTDPGTTQPDPNDEITASILSLTNTFRINILDGIVSIFYTVTGNPDLDVEGNSIISFQVKVADISADSEEIADPVVISSDLQAGNNKAFNFDPMAAGVGVFRVGIIVTVNGEQIRVTSSDVIVVEDTPHPLFINPLGGTTTTVRQGDTFIVKLDAGDPENDVQWRLFYLEENDPLVVDDGELVGNDLDTGSGNVVEFTFIASNFEPGLYELGLSATDSGSSVEDTIDLEMPERVFTIPTTAARGPTINVLAEDDPSMPPTLIFSAPASGTTTLFRDEAFVIEFTATANEPGANPTVEIFYDKDRNATQFTSIHSNLTIDATEVDFPTNLPEGTYNIGGVVDDGINLPVTVYANGQIEVVRNVSLTISSPNSDLTVKPGELVNIAWVTDAPISSGTVSVLALFVDASGEPLADPPDPIVIISPESKEPISTTSATFFSDSPGVFRIEVKLDLNFGNPVFPEPDSTRLIRVSSLPKILWLGSIAQATPSVDGAIFTGVQPEDNAGTSFTTAGDLNGDSNDDFVIVSRYGKPRFDNPNSIGMGEAYLIYGRGGTQKLRGLFNLNSVGTEGLTGVTLSGVRTDGNTDDTDGLSDVTLIPDADGDGKGELVFGFPRTNSAGNVVGPLCGAKQFLSGGVIILSSNNNFLTNPSQSIQTIRLDEVGQRFTNITSDVDGNNVFADLLTFDETVGLCIDGTDGIFDTVTGPFAGFVSSLAPPAWQQLDFEVVTSPPAPAFELCETQFELGDNSCFGSGFYPDTTLSLEPRGARIIGPDTGDNFGTSVTFSKPLDNSNQIDLIISAPNRTAEPGIVQGLDTPINDAGVAYIQNNVNLWVNSLPAPFQFIMGFPSYCDESNVSPTQVVKRMAGDSNDKIQIIEGIDDFNGDMRNDIAIGAPNANNGNGRVYIAYRRAQSLEGDFILNKFGDANDPENLNGLVIEALSNDAFGSSLASDIDFNGDGISDLVVGSPTASSGEGEIIIVFGRPDSSPPLNGSLTIDGLLTTFDDDSPLAVRIKGNPMDKGAFGFNIANAGDVNGDGMNDLLVSAPNASPRFDPNPADSIDELIRAGIDLDQDGLADDIPGDINNELLQAGLVYVIYGSNRLDQIKTCSSSISKQICNTDDDCSGGEGTCEADNKSISIDQLGKKNLSGFMIVGRSSDDRIGGGDAGDVLQGGILIKKDRGRSFGLATAGDVDNDGRADILIGAILADPNAIPNSLTNGGEAYLIYGSNAP